MFYGAAAFNQPIGSWNTSNVTTIADMFNGASEFDQDIGSWNTSKVLYMNGTFVNALKFNNGGNISIGSWNTSKVTNMSYMFYGAAMFNQDIRNWIVEIIPTEPTNFSVGSALIQINKPIWGGRITYDGVTIKWTGTIVPSPYYVQANPRGTGLEWFVIVNDVTKSNITDYAKNIQSGITYFTPPGASGPIPFNNIVTTLITNMSSMFQDAISFNQPIGLWDTSSVSNMSSMFYKAVIFNQSIGSWNTSNVTDTRRMFYGANSFNQNISLWNITNMKNSYDSMFQDIIIYTYKTYISTNTSDYNDGDSSYSIIQNVDDNLYTINLTTPFTVNGISYNTIYIHSNGSINFTSSGGDTFTYNNPHNYNALFSVGADLYFTGTDFIRYKEINDKFIIIYNCRYWSNQSARFQVKITLHLQSSTESGKITADFGTLSSYNTTTKLGISFGSGNSLYIKNINFLNYTESNPYIFDNTNSPIQNIDNIQSQYSNKQLIINPNPNSSSSTILTNIFLSNPTVSENVPIGTSIGSLFIDQPSPVIYTLITNPLNTFSISGSTLKTAASLNYKLYSSYNIEIRATVGSLNLIKPLTITVLPVVTDIFISNATFSENVPIGTVIGSLSTERSEPVIYEIIFSTLSSPFLINGSNLITNAVFNYKINPSYNIVIRATIGGTSITKTFTIVVTLGLTNILLSNTTVAENVPIGTVIGTLSTDQTSSTIYTLLTNPSNTFAISGSNLITNTFLNYTIYSSYNIVIRATVGSSSITKPFTISITDIPQTPTSIDIINGIGKNIPEDSPTGTFLGDLYTFDPDRTDYFIYRFVSGTGSTDNQLFIMDNGKLYTNTLFNYRVKNSYSIRLQSTDATNLSVEQVLILKVIIPYSPDSQITTLVGQDKSIVLNGTPVSGKRLTYKIIIPPTNGLLTGVLLSDKYTYRTNKNGTDFFTYVINEGTMTSEPIRVVIYNFSQADVSTISRNQGSFTFDNISFDGTTWRFGTFETDTFIQNGNYSRMGNFDFFNSTT